ncbi:DUF1588 domain-containing protein [Stieleria marina]|uniref:PA14 domain protein n=1 Tax=Stieleria marina TaxID=1930275 RepID=A0A517NXJ0_9BACT|nr:PA14 domain protein [Planctomycetes bacterium K23_9]
MPTQNVALGDDDAVRKKGEAIYQAACVECHGKAGEGVPEFYPDPLLGDATIGELTELIADTMPEEDPDTCVDDDAAAVSAYIHHAFYSEAAQVRNRPPRIRLARLTGEQLRQSLAGLYGSFDSSPWAEKSGGIKGIYFQGSRWDKKKIKLERTDPVIDFDFGHVGPSKEKGIDPSEFYIHWSGSLLANQTGRYEIIVRSTCSFVMDFGRDGREFVNNHVQSEGRTEFRQTLNLTGGRAYMFKIDFFQRKRKTEQPPATISLSWVPPGGVEEIVPASNLLPSWMPATLALQTKLPPDDRSYGYERGTAVNRQWDESTTNAAIEFSQYAISELWPHYERRHRKDSDENRARLRGFARELVSTAFRGKLSDAQQKVYIDHPIDQTPDDSEAIKTICLMALKSPRFLYPTLDFDQSESQRVANRLALVMYDSLPSDRWLQKLIEQNKLTTEKQISEAAWKMNGDFRLKAKTQAFLHEWLELTHSVDVSKDQKKFPGFDERIIADLRASLDAFLDDVVWSETSDYRELVNADWTITNERLAKFYGDKWIPADDHAVGLTRSVADTQTRMGVLSHPLLMANLSYHQTTSPIHRGVFLYRKTLGRTLRPPNAAFSPLNPDLHPKLTTRQRVSLQTDEVSCQVCHSKINTLGFALENFDPVGRFRITDNDQPVDASGSYVNRQGETTRFDGPRELAQYLATSSDAHRAFVDSCFEHFVKQPAAAYGADTLDRLTRQFQQDNFNIRQLIINIAVTVAKQTQASK